MFSQFTLALAVLAAWPSSASPLDQLPLTYPYPYLRSPPLLGFGTWNLDRSNATEAVSTAIRTGYKHIDCAAAYGNEKLVGAGIADGLRKARLQRTNIWITSKLWNDHHEPSLVPAALDQTLADLQLTYLDLYLMHWPVASINSTNEEYFLPTWHAMVDLLSTSKVRFIGICNFAPAQLDALLSATDHKPLVHQMELHPYLQQRDWIAYHDLRGIHVTAYSPLGGTNPTYRKGTHLPEQLLDSRAVAEVAEDSGCTPAQAVLAWGLGKKRSVIPKSSHAARIRENFGATACTRKLSAGDKEKIDGLGEVEHRFNNPSEMWGVDLFQGLDGV